MLSPMSDPWLDWLLVDRHGGDARAQQRLDRKARRDARRILARLDRASGGTLLDAGAGLGAIALEALELGACARAVLCDVSAAALREALARADRRGLADRVTALASSAERLDGVGDGSVDAVAMRSLLIHVADKPAVFSACRRVLAAGGQLAACEPINRPFYPEPEGRLWGYDVSPVWDVARKIRASYERLLPPGRDPMVDFDAWDLGAAVEAAGFDDVRIDVQARLAAVPPRSWDAFAGTAWNARCPPLAAAVRAVLDEGEAIALERCLRPLVEGGHGRRWTAVCYLWARRA